MLKNLIIDYRDMNHSDLSKEAALDSSGKYAVLVKTANALVGKFPVGTTKEIEQSIYAIENNDQMPIAIKESAQYYVKQAAAMDNISVSWESTPSLHIVPESALYEKKASNLVTLNIHNDFFPINDIEEIKIAEDYLTANIERLVPVDRIIMSRALIKAGELNDFIPNETIKTYAHATIGTCANDEISVRKIARKEDTQYVEALDKLSFVISTIDPIVFLDSVQQLDKLANYNVQRHNRDYASFLLDKEIMTTIDTDLIAKIATVTNDNNVASTLNKII